MWMILASHLIPPRISLKKKLKNQKNFTLIYLMLENTICYGPSKMLKDIIRYQIVWIRKSIKNI